ncbi:capsid protein [Pseudoalteromonas luteoviolacea]|uniref:capsid protein n=1 Tax=Pseudoalteromonas luteoviolacea TaxID=43657 RepID=UPI001E5106A8|nr:capsid protein [Pseudoalteromonas luteoviolacea]
MMSHGMPFTPDIEQTAIAIAYHNRRMIADDVCPRIPVGKRTFQYRTYDKAERMTIPNTRVGRKSAINQVEFTTEEGSASCEDHGLSDVVPNSDIKEAPHNYNPLHHATEGISDLMLLAREVRVAELFKDPTNYGYHYELGKGGLKFLDDDNLDILQFFQELIDDMLVTPNHMTLPRKILTKLRSCKHVIKAYNGSLGDSGLVPIGFIQDTLGIDKVHVGEAWVNTAKKGETPNFIEAWGNDHISLTRSDPLASANNGRMTFAFTAQFGDRISGRRDVAAGLDGAIEVMVGEKVKELSIAKDYGMILTNLLTP